jgi:hypothetical protein
MGHRQPLFRRVEALLGDNDKARAWFRTENPLLGGVSPDWMLENGRAMRLRKFIDEAEKLRCSTGSNDTGDSHEG